MPRTSGGIAVLHVDDEPDFADLASTFIERHDERLDVETATNASDGLDRLNENGFDCIVSDYNMPDMNGIEFLEAVRESYPDLPFILYTGKGSEEVASEAISAGVTDYLQKGSGTSQYAVLANRIGNAVEQRQAKRSFLESEQKLAQIAEKTDDILFMVDSDWEELLFVNSAYETVWGGSISELEEDPRSFLAGIHPEDADYVQETFENILAGEPTEVTYRIVTDDGDTRWMYSEGKPIFDNGGEFRQIVGIVRDITEYKQREMELEDANRLLTTLFETIPVGVTVLNADGQIVRANQRAEDVLGLSVSEITDRTYDDPAWEIVDENGDEIPSEDLPFSRVADTGQPVFDIQHGIRWPNGTLQWLSINAAPILNESGDAERVVATITDVTERRDTRESLQRQLDRLEKFSSVVSHDLKNPLSVAQGRLELVREDHDTEELQEIARAHDRMESLIDDLLTLARRGQDVEELVAVDLQTLAESCWQPEAWSEASLEITSKPSILADESRLRQILENLFRNAIEHGGEDVTVRIGELDNGFFVEDDGPGIPEDRRQDVFTAGFTTAEEGTGFGLAIVKEIAEAHGWKITLAESKSSGARFEFSAVQMHH